MVVNPRKVQFRFSLGNKYIFVEKKMVKALNYDDTKRFGCQTLEKRASTSKGMHNSRSHRLERPANWNGNQEARNQSSEKCGGCPASYCTRSKTQEILNTDAAESFKWKERNVKKNCYVLGWNDAFRFSRTISSINRWMILEYSTRETTEGTEWRRDEKRRRAKANSRKWGAAHSARNERK